MGRINLSFNFPKIKELKTRAECDDIITQMNLSVVEIETQLDQFNHEIELGEDRTTRTRAWWYSARRALRRFKVLRQGVQQHKGSLPLPAKVRTGRSIAEYFVDSAKHILTIEQFQEILADARECQEGDNPLITLDSSTITPTWNKMISLRDK